MYCKYEYAQNMRFYVSVTIICLSPSILSKLLIRVLEQRVWIKHVIQVPDAGKGLEGPLLSHDWENWGKLQKASAWQHSACPKSKPSGCSCCDCQNLEPKWDFQTSVVDTSMQHTQEQCVLIVRQLPRVLDPNPKRSQQPPHLAYETPPNVHHLRL